MTHFAETSAAERELLPAERRGTRLWLWLALLAVVALYVGWRLFGPVPAEEAGQGRRHPAVGTKFAAVNLEPLTGGGQPVAEADLAGKVTVINFWGPWCGYCREEFPHLVELEEHYRSRSDFQFLSVSSAGTPQGDATLQQDTMHFLQQQRAAFRTFRDPDDHTKAALIQAAHLDHFGFPTTLVLDRTGTIRGLWDGFRPGDQRHLQIAIDAALQ